MRHLTTKIAPATLAALLAATLIATGFGEELRATPAAADPPDAPPKPAFAEVARVEAAATDSPLRKLQKERLNLLVERLKLTRQAAKQGAVSEPEIHMFQHQLAEADAEVNDRPADLRKLIELRFAAAKASVARLELEHAANRSSLADLLAARQAKLDVEIALAKLPAKP